ncbi:hypothetical protein LZ30DRAFT_787566 [Colletotrichum cereale]|nr:hypothetical protein LZ30DRAFT_787566 [Colletotrichum cereale]
MTKRAVTDPRVHTFFPVNFKSSRKPETVMCDATISLWKAGVDNTYWPWFSRKSFLTQWVDRPAEVQKRLDTAFR